MAVKSILSILLFIGTYILMIASALALTFATSYLGIMLITLHPSFLTLILGAGLISIGVLVTIFLFKFIAKKHVVDRSNLVEITWQQEPALFAFIEEIVKEVNSQFPKKVYISSEVNASVFYDSSFWSMILPVRKNLQIGYGLVNAVTITELKAILSHEFGHFSQRSMKVGSYVYYVNQIIYNLLNENSSFEILAGKWGSVNNTLAFFVGLAVKIVQGIQWVLRKVYKIVNLNYLSLSREMEFHADEVAANVTGHEPLISSLLRLDLASYSYNIILDFYSTRIPECVRTKNVYPQQQFVMVFQAGLNNVPVENNLPTIRLDDLGRYNKSRLFIKDQWASHPSLKERIQKLQQLSIPLKNNDTAKASLLFKNPEETQQMLTEYVFSEVKYEKEVTDLETRSFEHEYVTNFQEISFSAFFNSYYDNKNPGLFSTDQLEITDSNISDAKDLFSDEVVDIVYTINSLEADIATLRQIGLPDSEVRSFDFDGKKYRHKDCNPLIKELEEELIELKERIEEHDLTIYHYFLQKSREKGRETEYLEKVENYKAFDLAYEDKIKICIKVKKLSEFIYVTTPFDTIRVNLITLSYAEEELKLQIRTLMEEEYFQSLITEDLRKTFTDYTSKEWQYFTGNQYEEGALNVLFSSLNSYEWILNRAYMKYKKDLLILMEELGGSQQ
ncbi:MAG: M48 family metalloprotease [Bacteroidales bacterium]|nr:M48 family metalloprotease [Bacteroidales bacterium]